MVGKFLLRHEIESAADLEKSVVDCFGIHDSLILVMLMLKRLLARGPISQIDWDSSLPDYHVTHVMPADAK